MTEVRRFLTSPFTLALAVGLVVLGVLLAPALHAQEALDLTLQQAVPRDDGQTRVILEVDGVAPGTLDADDFTVTEAGQAVAGPVTVQSASEVPDPEPQAVVLAIDVSGSTEGQALANTIAAATAFTEEVTDQGVAVGLVSFAGQAVNLQSPTTDAALVVEELQQLDAGGPTVLYDGVVESARVLQDVDALRSIVVFSDGGDTRSTATLAGAATAANTVGAPITSVALRTDDLDIGALESLADRTGGGVVAVDDVAGLGSAFQSVADSLNNQYVLEYPTSETTGTVPIEVIVTSGSATAADTIEILKADRPPPSEPPEVVAVPPPGLFANTWVGPAAVGAAALGLLVLLLALFVPVGDRRVARNLQAAVGPQDAPAAGRQELTPTTAAMSRRAIALVERVPKPEGYDLAMQKRIDRAGWPLRSSEFTTMRALATLVGFGLGWSLTENVLFGFVLGAVGWVVPNLVLGSRLTARQKKFMDQLPDTLQLLAGSLKAGYGVLQAIDTVVKETGDPTRSEFQRVLSEARLGLPLDESLSDMADRIGTDDFRWVAVSISIQRRVGGNLAQLLETVASTLRERGATRRQISALSAEGRLSAIILTGLPVGIGLYLLVVSPEYLAPLTTSGVGQAMLAGSAVLMVIGVLWMRKLIEIDV